MPFLQQRWPYRFIVPSFKSPPVWVSRSALAGACAKKVASIQFAVRPPNQLAAKPHSIRSDLAAAFSRWGSAIL